MKRFYITTIFAVAALLLCVGCVEKQRAQPGDFKLLSSVTDGKILLDCREGASTTIDIFARYDWDILSTEGFVCMPSSGVATESTSIDIVALSDNNTTDTVKLGDLNFRLLSTRFIGLSVYQLPRMMVDRRRVILSSNAGAENSVYVTTDEPFEVVYDEGQPFRATVDSENKSVTIAATVSNDLEQDITLGKLTIRLIDEPACSAEIEILQRHSDTPQTILYYLLGTSLKAYYQRNMSDIVEALSANVQGKSRVIAVAQSSTTDAALYEFRYDAETGSAVKEKVRDIKLTLPYDAALLTKIMNEAFSYAPARQYGLVIGSHGTGWLPKKSSEVEKMLMRMGSSYEKFWLKREDALPTRHIGDNATTVQYDISELAAAIKGCGIKLEYIIFDACYMSNIESNYILRGVADYIVGSPCEVMAQGMPHDLILPHLLLNGGLSYDLDAICRIYVDTYRNSTSPWAAVAMTVSSEMEALAACMKRVNGAAKVDSFTFDTVQYYEGLSEHLFYDLEDYVRQSCADAEVVEQFKAQLAKSVVSRYHTDNFYTVYGNEHHIPIVYYSGVTTSVGNEEYAAQWRETEWYRDTEANE